MRSDDLPTQPIPRESLAECAAHHRAQLAEQGLIGDAYLRTTRTVDEIFEAVRKEQGR